MPDVVGLERLGGINGGVVGHLYDRYPLEDGLDRVLAVLPVAGPEQADRAVYGIHNPAARFVQKRPENCYKKKRKKECSENQ